MSGYGDNAYADPASYLVQPGGPNAPYGYLSDPGSSYYHTASEGSTTYVNSAYENYYGGKSYYAATLNPSGDYTKSSYEYQSPYRSQSDIGTYISHPSPYSGQYSYYANGYYQSSASYNSVDAVSYTNGAYKYFGTVSSSSEAYFNGSFSNTYFYSTFTEYNGQLVTGSEHTYSASSYTDPSGYSVYQSSQT